MMTWQDHVETRLKEMGVTFFVRTPGVIYANEREISIELSDSTTLELVGTDPMNRDIAIIATVTEHDPVRGYQEWEVALLKTPHAAVSFIRGWLVETMEMDAEWDEIMGQGTSL